MARIIIENQRDRQWLMEKYRTVKKSYRSKALAFQLNTDLAIAIRRDALKLKSATLIDSITNKQ
ncbi:MAG: hypothetical protein II706_04090 [Bacteroidaceae bacterium]|jgi:hypothetical protein|nr:hypothetical protein [Bacteroidaceae bacterium]